MNIDECINANYKYESLCSLFVSHLNSNKNNNNFESPTQEDLVCIIFNEFISEHKICEQDSENISILQDDAQITSRYVKIIMDCDASASIIHNSFVRTDLC